MPAEVHHVLLWFSEVLRLSRRRVHLKVTPYGTVLRRCAVVVLVGRLGSCFVLFCLACNSQCGACVGLQMLLRGLSDA